MFCMCHTIVNIEIFIDQQIAVMLACGTNLLHRQINHKVFRGQSQIMYLCNEIVHTAYEWQTEHSSLEYLFRFLATNIHRHGEC